MSENYCTFAFDEKDVIETYNKFNTLFFFGKLPTSNHIKFLLDVEGDGLGGYSAVNNRNGYVSEETHKYDDNFYYVIALNSKDIKNRKDFECVLCHEMIHIWQWEEINFEKYTEDYSWISGHNKTFVSKMNMINLLAKEEYFMDLEVKIAGKFQ